MTARGGKDWAEHPGVRLGFGDRAADLCVRVAGSWPCLLSLAVLATVAVCTVPLDDRTAPGTMLALALAGLAVVEIPVVLMATRRQMRTSAEVALYDLDQARRATAVAEDLRTEVQRLHTAMARLTAQTERLGRPAGDTGASKVDG